MKLRIPLLLMPIVSICLLLTSCSNNQTETDKYKEVAGKFEDYYDNAQFDSIFNMFSNDMQKALPWDRTNTFLTRVKSDAGAIVSMDFEKYESRSAIYKTQFEKTSGFIKLTVNHDKKITGYVIKINPPEKSDVPDTFPKMERNTTLLELPFKGEWTVDWGGDTKELNHHVGVKAQKNAFDIVIRDKNGQSYKTDGKNNDDYYAFGQEILAPCDGEVVLAVDGIKDNTPGEVSTYFVPGNVIVLKTINNEYLVFCHFKQHSIKVSQGQKVKLGQVLGLCGNTGHSTEPHLHFHIQNIENMDVATGVKCYFDKILVNGVIKTDYSPIKGDRIQNIGK